MPGIYDEPEYYEAACAYRDVPAEVGALLRWSGKSQEPEPPPWRTAPLRNNAVNSKEPLIKSLGAATEVLKPRPFGFRRYEPICGAAEPGRESLISTRNLQLASGLISSETRLPEDLIRGSSVNLN